MKLFVSYTMRDGYITPSVLRKVEKILINEGHSVFIDYLNNDSKRKQERVIQELKNSDQVLLLLSPRVMQSKWVNFELGCARCNRIEIITCKIINNILIREKYA